MNRFTDIQKNIILDEQKCANRRSGLTHAR
jgi:hypothetical protein